MDRSMDAAARKAQLEDWIRNSSRARVRIARGSVIVAMAGILIAFALHRFTGVIVVTGGVAFGICGGWITTAHILTFRGLLHDLEAGRFQPRGIAVRQGRGRNEG